MSKATFLLSIILVFVSSLAFGQSIKGTIEDPETGEKLFGAAILEKGTSNGVTTDFDGKFTLTPQGDFPVTLVISYIGYNSQEFTVASPDEKVKVKLEPENIQLESVNVIESRITAKQQESPVTVESMDAMAVKETPAVNFYDGLGSLKGVDLTAASMGFKVVNTRGFNSTRPVRSLQIIDGVDNQAPGLNFSVGNFAGVSELDVQRVELIVGANSGLYGPNAFNGVISMETKNPFIHKGLSVMGKVGERNLREGAFRYADAHKLFGSEKEVIAYKLNVTYMEALDWEADNNDPTLQSEVGSENPGGYDAVNRYGDEKLIPRANDFRGSAGNFALPGLGIFYRTGYWEEDIVDYDTKNLKVAPALYFKVADNTEVKLGYNYGSGTTVYQGDNRYSLKDFQIHQMVFEVQKKNKFFVRAYRTQEDAGNSYDAVFTALLMQDAVKSNANWDRDYVNYWTSTATDKVRKLPGYPDPNDIDNLRLWRDDREAAEAMAALAISENIDSIYLYHDQARAFADGKTVNGLARYQEGTAAFDSALASITSKKTFGEGGSGFFDKSALNHANIQYTFDKKEFGIDPLSLTLGASYRLYEPNSEGTIFSDTGDVKITNSEYGIYGSLQYRFFENKLIAIATGRMDKNENFNAVYSPAASLVYSPRQNHSVRFSFSSALRNPTLQDQYLYYNIGRAILLGNITGYRNLVTVESYFNSRQGDAVFDSTRLEYFDVDPVRPERVRTFEVGYKGQITNQFYFDMSYYYSSYVDFMGFIIGADVTVQDSSKSEGRPIPDATLNNIYRVTANSNNTVTTQGFSIGLNYYFWKYYALNGNYSWNVLNQELDDPIIPAFNTPEHKFNVGISGRDIMIKLGSYRLKYIGFNINYKWIEGFLFEGSPQFTGEIPTYDMIDAQVSYTAKKIHTTFKLGASNLLDRQNYHVYGGPRIGRLAYFSVLFDLAEL